MSGKPYVLAFRLDGPIEAGDVIWSPAAAVNITKGQALIDDGSGFATNTPITAFAATFIGIAGADCSNSAGAAGDLSVMVIKPNPKLYFWVPNGSATVAAATDRGEVIDLKSATTVDVTDNTLVSFGFEVVEIDISTAALAANAGGFVKGRFMPQPQ